MVQPGCILYFSETLNAIHAGHVDVHKYQVGLKSLVVLQFFQRFVRVVRIHAFHRLCYLPEGDAKNVVFVLIVVDQETGDLLVHAAQN
jgi:hypothetical protein